MRIEIDLSEIANMISTDEITDEIADRLEGIATDIFVDLTAPPPIGTPVDTGQARNGWQLDVSTKLAPEVYNMVPHIGALNNGHSQQSPAGYVDAIVDKHIR